MHKPVAGRRKIGSVLQHESLKKKYLHLHYRAELEEVQVKQFSNEAKKVIKALEILLKANETDSDTGGAP